MMPGGHHIDPGHPDWITTVKTGVIKNVNIAIMSDIEFLIDFAQQSGCVYHYTGVENSAEVAWERNYMKAHHISCPMTGENAGVASVAKFPDEIIASVIANNVQTFDFVNSSYLFEADGITPNGNYAALGKAVQNLWPVWGGFRRLG
jgi:hypothetical protein